jgi:hypothetical protein
MRKSGRSPMSTDRESPFMDHDELIDFVLEEISRG